MFSEKMARPKGFEPLTPRFVVWCSIQLSYGRLLGGFSPRTRRLICHLGVPMQEPICKFTNGLGAAFS